MSPRLFFHPALVALRDHSVVPHLEAVVFFPCAEISWFCLWWSFIGHLPPLWRCCYWSGQWLFCLGHSPFRTAASWPWGLLHPAFWIANTIIFIIVAVIIVGLTFVWWCSTACAGSPAAVDARLTHHGVPLFPEIGLVAWHLRFLVLERPLQYPFWRILCLRSCVRAFGCWPSRRCIKTLRRASPGNSGNLDGTRYVLSLDGFLD